jgi:tRNA (guanosine-2'-O-)-methyltransferase
MADLALLRHLETFISEERRRRFIQVLQQRTRFLTVAMEDVFQLHNSSAVLRSCDVFGIQDLHLIEGRFGKRLDRKIAMGAQQWVDLHRHSSATACMDHLRSRGYRIVATTPMTTAISLEDFNPDKPTALFFGTEKEGLSREVLEGADTRLRIPMTGFTESLNISVAAAIILHQLCTALRTSDQDWQLNEEEILDLRLKCTKSSIKSVDGIIKRFMQAGEN